LITGDNEANINMIQAALKKEFEMTDLGQASQYLGAEFEYHKSGIWVHQRSYIKRLLAKFRMVHCKGCDLPMDLGCKLKKEMETPKIDSQFYRSLVGSLIYVTNTRPDICYAVSNVSRFMDEPKEAHLKAANQILKYLRQTLDFGLLFASEGQDMLHSFVDADWGRDIDTWRSTSGLLHKIGNSSID
jgi:hypothetical protein